MGTIECWSVIGLKGLKTYRLLLIIQSTLKCTSLGLASNTTLISAKSEVITGKSQTEVITSRWSLSFSCNDWVDEVNKLFIICDFNKNTGSNFQHPVVSLLGHSRSCSRNQNKPDDVINTTRYTSFDNETVFVFITSRSWPNWTTLKKFHNARSLQENLANSRERILCAINITVHLILRVVSAL